MRRGVDSRWRKPFLEVTRSFFASTSDEFPPMPRPASLAGCWNPSSFLTSFCGSIALCGAYVVASAAVEGARDARRLYGFAERVSR